MKDMNLYWQWDASDMPFAAGDVAMLSIYVNAEKFDNGEFGFDCGHDWLLVAETPFGNYPLFPRQHVRHYGVSCVIVLANSGNAYDVFRGLITVQSSVSYEIYECVFDEDRKAFKITPVYSAVDIVLAESQIKK
jgi:hypothetical protein